MSSAESVLGIDLGTTYSRVAVFVNGQVEIIRNDFGARATPSSVGFTESERLIGDAAINDMEVNHTNTVNHFKRLIGCCFDHPGIQRDMKHWPFEVTNDRGKPKIQVMYKRENICLTPEEISAMILFKLKKTAESYLHKLVKDAVITVPASFNDSQRRATINAAKIVGLNVLHIINEPTATAIAYDYRMKNRRESNILVIDLGGGTFDVSLLKIENGHFRTRSTAGDTHLGGENFTRRMVDHFVKEFEKKHGKDVSNDKLALTLLFTACEKAKQDLSSLPKAAISINSFFDGIHFQSSITRTQFEVLNVDLFDYIINLVKDAIHDAKICPSDIQEILLVGGSSRIPKIQMMLQELFDKKKFNKTIHPDEAVVEGAAIKAAFGSRLPIDEVAPFSLRLISTGGLLRTLVDRTKALPTTTFPIRFEISEDNPAEEIVLSVYEGEARLITRNPLLGQFKLNVLRGASIMEVTFQIDANGVLKVEAVDLSSRKSKNIIIIDENWLSDKELNQMTENAERYNQDDREKMKRFSARNNFETFCRDLQSSLERVNNYYVNKDLDLTEICEQMIQWLKDSPLATEEEIKEKEEYLKASVKAADIKEEAINPSRDELLPYGASQLDSPFPSKRGYVVQDGPIGRSQLNSSHGSSQQIPPNQRAMPFVHPPIASNTSQGITETPFGGETGNTLDDVKSKKNKFFFLNR